SAQADARRSPDQAPTNARSGTRVDRSAHRGYPLGSDCPTAWRAWVELGTHAPSLAPPTVIFRSRDRQPAVADKPLLDLVHKHFKSRAYDLEQVAADVWRVTEHNVDRIDVTRPGATAATWFAVDHL